MPSPINIQEVSPLQLLPGDLLSVFIQDRVRHGYGKNVAVVLADHKVVIVAKGNIHGTNGRLFLFLQILLIKPCARANGNKND